MGFEYRFIVKHQDKENLSRWPDGINTLDKLLQAAPGYQPSDSKDTYTFTDSSNELKWSPMAHMEPDGFIICIFSRSPASFDMRLLNHLIHDILNRCGRVCIEDV